MVYLFWAFALVWLGVFAYLYRLERRSRALERQVLELLGRVGPATDAGDVLAGTPLGTPGRSDRTVTDGRTSPAARAAGAGDA